MKYTKPIVRVVLGLGLWAAIAPAARGQVQFFTPGVTAFSPEIGVVNSGVLNDVQATVSPDRRYVTLGMRPANSELIALREFSFQNPGGKNPGFVGGAVVEPSAGGALGAVNEPVVLGPGRAAALLRQRGMTPVRVR